MNELLLQFIDTLQTSMRQFQAQNGESFTGLTISQIDYLEAIAALGSPTISEIASVMGFSKPSVTDAVKKLEKLGFVTKERSTQDRRVVHVKLTEKGQKLKTAKQRTLEQYENFIRTSLDEKELSQFEQILEKLVSAFAANDIN
jgi:DNA-binding MarR family transcriptional regulator